MGLISKNLPSLEVSDPVGDSDSPVLVLGPALGTSEDLWRETIEVLSKNFRVVTWNLPGHGNANPATHSFSVIELADELAASVRKLDSKTNFYAGVSIGGMIGIELGIRHSDLFPSIAVIASGAKLGEPNYWHQRARQIRSLGTASILEITEQRWFAPKTAGSVSTLPMDLINQLTHVDNESYALCCEAIANYDSRERLPNIKSQILALWGEHDFVAPREKSLEIASHSPGGKIGMISNVGHLPPAERPLATANILINFFPTKR